MDFEFILKMVKLLLIGTITTVELTAFSVVAGMAFGLFLALGKLSKNKNLSLFSGAYIWFFRGSPLMIQIFLIYYGLPQLGITLSAMPAALIALSLNSAAYLAEIIRGAIQSIDKGQMEAAKALGMTYSQAMRRIIIPQSYRRLIPPVGNEFIALLKDSALVATIAMVELMRTAQIMVSYTGRPFEIYAIALIMYLVLTSLFTVAFNKLEKKYSMYE